MPPPLPVANIRGATWYSFVFWRDFFSRFSLLRHVSLGAGAATRIGRGSSAGAYAGYIE